MSRSQAERGGARAHFMPTYCLPACSACSVDGAYFTSIYAGIMLSSWIFPRDNIL